MDADVKMRVVLANSPVDDETFARLGTKESFDRAKAQNVPKEQLGKSYCDKARRVVIREYTADVFMPDGLHSTFVREGGVWKCAA